MNHRTCEMLHNGNIWYCRSFMLIKGLSLYSGAALSTQYDNGGSLLADDN